MTSKISRTISSVNFPKKLTSFRKSNSDEVGKNSRKSFWRFSKSKTSKSVEINDDFNTELNENCTEIIKINDLEEPVKITKDHKKKSSEKLLRTISKTREIARKKSMQTIVPPYDMKKKSKKDVNEEYDSSKFLLKLCNVREKYGLLLNKFDVVDYLEEINEYDEQFDELIKISFERHKKFNKKNGKKQNISAIEYATKRYSQIIYNRDCAILDLAKKQKISYDDALELVKKYAEDETPIPNCE